MAVRVQLQDAVVEIGGSFEAALAFVKAQAGRRYDPATRTWTVPMGLTDLRLHAEHRNLPVDVVESERLVPASGAHITRYGTVYAEPEWEAKKAEIEAEKRIAAARSAKVAEAEREAGRRLLALGIAPEAVERLVGQLLDIEELEEAGRIRSSSEERRQAVYAVAEWFGDEVERIAREADEALEAERQRIWRGL